MRLKRDRGEVQGDENLKIRSEKEKETAQRERSRGLREKDCRHPHTSFVQSLCSFKT